MASVDPGGELKALRMTIQDLRNLGSMFDLGLKQRDAERLAALEKRQGVLAAKLDIDEEGNLGFDAYLRMVKSTEDKDNIQLPRIRAMRQALCDRKAGSNHVSFRMVDSENWLAVLKRTPKVPRSA
ncbi:hypothetical protein T484DRAFT_1803077 [Baffinella frigidus]|nr:hypothetical protein T484DRAFT_1803077 [Cryptophyta sp. CCMP2293]